MPFVAAIAAAGALYYYLRAPPSTVTHSQPLSSSSDMGSSDLSGSDLASLYLDELRSLESSFTGGGVPGMEAAGGAAGAGVPITSQPTLDYSTGQVSYSNPGGGLPQSGALSSALSAPGGVNEVAALSAPPPSGETVATPPHGGAAV